MVEVERRGNDEDNNDRDDNTLSCGADNADVFLFTCGLTVNDNAGVDFSLFVFFSVVLEDDRDEDDVF